MPLNRQELAAGAIFIALGLIFGLDTWLELDIGTARRMGPGYFPLGLSCVLVLLGFAIALRGVRLPEAPLATMPWRGLAVLLPIPVVFGLTIRGFGLVPVVALVAFLSTFASRRATAARALSVAAVLTVLSALIFYYGLGLPLRLFGPWTGPLAELVR